MSQPVIEAHHLTKRYDGFVAVEDLNLAIAPGEVFGFLGPNGSGKTTSILMFLGLTEPTSGTARVWGFNCTREALKVKRVAGYLPENVGFYDDLSAQENLSYTAHLNGLPRGQARKKIGEALDYVGLGDVKGKRVGHYSRGMRQRLAIADVLIKEPKVVFLDEPTLGLDPEGMNQVLELILGMSRERGITAVVSSHQLHQVQRICHRVGIMSRGKMVAQGTVEQLGGLVGGAALRVEIEVEGQDEQLPSLLGKLPGVKGVEAQGKLLTVRCDPAARPLLARAVLDRGLLLVQMRSMDLTLEEIYLKYFREA